jgi:hypothetical protein
MEHSASLFVPDSYKSDRLSLLRCQCYTMSEIFTSGYISQFRRGLHLSHASLIPLKVFYFLCVFQSCEIDAIENEYCFVRKYPWDSLAPFLSLPSWREFFLVTAVRKETCPGLLVTLSNMIAKLNAKLHVLSEEPINYPVSVVRVL